MEGILGFDWLWSIVAMVVGYWMNCCRQWRVLWTRVRGMSRNSALIDLCRWASPCAAWTLVCRPWSGMSECEWSPSLASRPVWSGHTPWSDRSWCVQTPPSRACNLGDSGWSPESTGRSSLIDLGLIKKLFKVCGGQSVKTVVLGECLKC